MDIKQPDRKGYTYKRWNNKYEIYVLDEEEYKSPFLIYVPNQQELITLLKTQYNAMLKPEGTHNILYSVWFDTKQEAEQAIEYLNARLLMKKLGCD